jgi:ankyrin repeat protein
MAQLHDFVETEDWFAVEECLVTPEGIAEAKELGDDEGLPIHYHELYSAPSHLIIKLIDAYPEGLLVTNAVANLPLHVALQHEASVEVIQHMLEKGGAAARHANNLGKIPLHFAATHPSPEVLRSVHEAYPDGVQRVTEHNTLPLHHACQEGTDYAVRFLLRANPNAARIQDWDTESFDNSRLPLHHACSKTENQLSLLVFEDLCSSFPGGLDILDDSGRTPLSVICESTSLDHPAVQYVFDQKPKALRVVDRQGKIPIHYICESQNELSNFDLWKKMLKSLPSALFREDRDGKTPMIYLFWNSCEEHGETWLDHMARKALMDSSSFVTKLLQASYEVLSETEHNVFIGPPIGHMLSYFAAAFDERDTTKMMISLASADTTAMSRRDISGNTLMHTMCLGMKWWKERWTRVPCEMKKETCDRAEEGGGEEAGESSKVSDDEEESPDGHLSELCQLLEFLSDFTEQRLVRAENNSGELPLHLALRDHVPSKAKARSAAILVHSYPLSRSKVDPETHLYPFMLAALGKKSSSLEATHTLLQHFVSCGDLSRVASSLRLEDPAQGQQQEVISGGRARRDYKSRRLY